MGHRCKKLFNVQLIWNADLFVVEEGDQELNEETHRNLFPCFVRIIYSSYNESQWKNCKNFSAGFVGFREFSQFSKHQVGQKTQITIQKNKSQNMVANGEVMDCASICIGGQLYVTFYKLVTDFYLLELDNLDAVLGVTWLQTLSPMVWDFSALTMSFTENGQSFILHGSVVRNSQMTSSKRISQSIQKSGKGMYLQMQLVAEELNDKIYDMRADEKQLQ